MRLAKRFSSTAPMTERWQVKCPSGSGRSPASVHRIVRPVLRQLMEQVTIYFTPQTICDGWSRTISYHKRISTGAYQCDGIFCPACEPSFWCIDDFDAGVFIQTLRFPSYTHPSSHFQYCSRLIVKPNAVSKQNETSHHEVTAPDNKNAKSTKKHPRDCVGWLRKHGTDGSCKSEYRKPTRTGKQKSKRCQNPGIVCVTEPARADRKQPARFVRSRDSWQSTSS